MTAFWAASAVSMKATSVVLEVVGAVQWAAGARRQAPGAAEVGHPDEEQRRLVDELLVIGQRGEPGLTVGILHRDDTPGLEV